MLEIVAHHAQRFDVIHCHTDWTHLPLVTRLGVPFLTTLHNRLDTPGLPDRYLRKALRTLTAHRADLVLGPARDGGYYLIGLTSPAPELFDGVPWSTKHVYATTLERARRLGLRVASLPPWEDVDTPDALGRLAATLARASGTIAPRTKRWLAAAP